MKSISLKVSKTILATLMLFSSISCGGGGGGGGSGAVLFELVIENITAIGAISPSDGSPGIVFFSSGVAAVHLSGNPIYSAGLAAPANGLEELAEDGNPSILGEALTSVEGVELVGIFQTPVGSEAPDILGPGESYRLVFQAEPGRRLSIATMFVQSNDLFYAFAPEGIALFDGSGNPVTGDLSAQLNLYDAGTEVNQEPGVGSDQPFRQDGANSGADEGGVVRPVDDGFTYPAVTAAIRVTLNTI